MLLKNAEAKSNRPAFSSLCVIIASNCFCSQAIKSLSRIAQTQDGLEALFVSSLLSDLKNVMATNDVVRYRVYEVGMGSTLSLLLCEFSSCLFCGGKKGAGGVQHCCAELLKTQVWERNSDAEQCVSLEMHAEGGIMQVSHLEPNGDSSSSFKEESGVCAVSLQLCRSLFQASI